MCRVSVIMPLYNAEKYLEECLDSVMAQTFTDFELICVNDASTDDTLEIAERFWAKDSRIKILNNDVRSGAAYARNKGMEEAQGEYLAFLDGDDIFDEGMLGAAYQTAIDCMADIVMYEYKHVPSELINRKLKVSHSKSYRERYSKRPFSILEYEPYECLNWALSPCNKIYRREFVQKHRLTFQNLPSSNDVYFVCMALMLSERSLLLDDERVMVYARDHGGPDRISADRDPMCAYRAFLHIAEELKARGLFDSLYACFYYRFFRAMKSALRQCKMEERAKEFYGFLREKGLDEICSVSGDCTDKLDMFIRTEMERFRMQDFDSGWYKEEPGLKMELSQKPNAEKVTALFEEYKRANKKVGIWGVGANGVSVLAFCRKNHLQVDMVIDRAEEKQGCIVEGYPVEEPERIKDRLDVIIVSARHIAEGIKKELSDSKVEVIDLNEFLYVY